MGGPRLTDDELNFAAYSTSVDEVMDQGMIHHGPKVHARREEASVMR